MFNIVPMVFIILSLAYGQLHWAQNFNNPWQGPQFNQREPVIPDCRESTGNPYGQIDLREPTAPSVFRDLTLYEITQLRQYLYAQQELNLQANSRSTNANYIYVSELFRPPKENVLQHLDRGLQQPAREARVVIVRLNQRTPDVVEVIVGPLPNPTYYRLNPVRTKPITPEYLPQSFNLQNIISTRLKEYTDSVAGRMLLELYGGHMTNCGNRCLTFGFTTHVASSVSGVPTRLAWHWVEQLSEYYVVHPIDFSMLVEKRGQYFKVHRVYFHGRLFNSLPETVSYYHENKFNITKIPFPNDNDHNLFSTLRQRGEPHLQVPLRNPIQISPDGKRYNVRDRHVSYMFWDFDVSLGIENGPQLFDIKFKKERIAYELSIQEVAALYSGVKPHEQLDLFDSYMLLGTLSNYLVPGVDCPSDATFISAYFMRERNIVFNKHAMCIFEFNTGLPLRRHYSYSSGHSSFYEGMETTILTARSILTVSNYDYFIDYNFYVNGAIEVKAIATGYITGTFFHKNQEQYGYRLHDNLLGPLHHHLFHFKVDMDIKGTSNRFKTSTVVLDIVENYSNIDNKRKKKLIYQNKIIHKYHKTEKEASRQADKGDITYLLITNEKAKDRYGNVAGYRIYNRQPTDFIRPFGSRNEYGLSWARYKVAITKQKDKEPRSSSMYSYLDDEDSVVNFQTFVEDNEWIIDQDLVAWITLGLHHIPHKEDLPVTHTAGMDSSFMLTPYNYFDQDPAISSTNAVRLEKTNGNDIQIQRYGVRPGIDCMGTSDMMSYIIRRDTCDIFYCGS